MIRILFASVLALGMASLGTGQPPPPPPMPAPQPAPFPSFMLKAWTPGPLAANFTTDEKGKAGAVWDSTGDPAEYVVGTWIMKDVNGAWVDVENEWNVKHITNGSILVNNPNTVGSLGVGTYCVCCSSIKVATGKIQEETWKYFTVQPAP